MSFDLLILGATLVSSERTEVADVGVRDGKIVEIGALRGQAASQEVEADGLFLLPGLIDTQVHFREPGMEHKEDLESGTRAALYGGVTTIFEMPNTQPTTSTAETLQDKLNRAEGRAWVNYGFFVGATTDNANDLAQLEQRPGTPGVKIFMGSSTGTLLVPDNDHLRAVLRAGKRRVSVHSEDHFRLEERKALLSSTPHPREHPVIRDAETAVQSTRRLLALSKETGRPVHILHISTADEIPLIAAAVADGTDATAEVTPQHLWFDGEDYERLGTLLQMNPPIRSGHHREAIRAALKSGFFRVFGSDHAPHTLEEKQQPYPKSPSGMPGVQTLLPALATLMERHELGSIQTLVRMACEAPADLFGIRGKGKLEVGADADLVLVNLGSPWTFERRHVQSKCGWSPYEGETFTAQVEHVWVRGEHALAAGEHLSSPKGQAVTFDWK